MSHYNGHSRKKLKTNITDLLLFFDELMEITNEELGVYWLKTTRSDGLTITLTFSIHEQYADIIISNSATKVGIVGLSLKNCSEIRILDEQLKCLEILKKDKTSRVFLSMLSDSILDYSE